MGPNEICLNCFRFRGEYEVCPHCGYVDGTPPKEAYLLYPGTVLAERFIAGTVLGTGGFGATYRAWDTKLSIVVAIKEFYPGGLVSRIPGESRVRLFSGDKEENFKKQLERFLDEARNMARFTGEKQIVNVFDFFEENNTAYIVMEFLDGLTLKEYMAQKGGSIHPEEALSIIGDVLTAVESIHKKNIIHRDISPDNIFILFNGSVKVLDFGAARFAVDENPAFTQSIVIKMGYAPPEQYRSNMKQGVWTDIYALGATLYKLLTGVTPEESIDRTEKDLLKRPSQLGIRLEPHVEKAVMKAMALKPELRFKSVEQMRAALDKRVSVDFPEEELKKRKRTRGVMVALAVALILAMGTYAGYESSKPGQKTLADLDISQDEIVLSISPDSKMEEKGIYSELSEAFTKTYPQYRVRVESEGDTGDIYLCSPENKNVKRADLGFLLDSLNRNDYWFLNHYEAYYPDRDKIPSGFDFYTVFADEIAAQDAEVRLPEEITSKEELEELSEAFSGESVYGAFSGHLRQVQEEWPGHYRVISYVEDGALKGKFEQEFAVNAGSSLNRQQVGMLFLHFILSEYAQNLTCVQRDSFVPLNKKAFAQYVEINQDYSFLTAKVKAADKKAIKMQ